MLGVECAHDGALHEMLGLAVDVRSRIEEERHALWRRHRRRDCRAIRASNASENKLRCRHCAACRASGKHGVAGTFLDEPRRDDDGGVLLFAHGSDGMLAHLYDLARVQHRNAQVLPAFLFGKDPHELLLIPDENDLAAIFLRSPNCTEDDLLRRIIPAHGIHCNLHERSFLPRHMPHSSIFAVFAIIPFKNIK